MRVNSAISTVKHQVYLLVVLCCDGYLKNWAGIGTRHAPKSENSHGYCYTFYGN